MVTTERTKPANPDRATTDGRDDILESRDPATGELLGVVHVTPPDAVEGIAAEAATAARSWARRPLRERSRIVERAAQVMLRRSEELATAVTRETGKTLMEATAIDVGAGAMVLAWIGENAPRYLSAERVPTPQVILKHKRHTIVYRPLGVVGVISAWNYPLLVPAGPVGMALVAGNAVVLKPSESTPLVGDLLASVFAEAGLPNGVLRIVHGTGPTGAAICSAPSIAKVCFTGGVANGEAVRRLAGEHGKPVVLELGGKDPAIVCHDADLDRAVAGTLWAATAGAGQTCAGVERVYVDRRVYRDYLDRLTRAVADIRVGHPMDPSTQLGPLISDAQFDRVMDACRRGTRSKGARLETGGPVDVEGLSGRFIAPIVLTGVDHSMAIMRDETFGPVIPVMPFEDEAEASSLRTIRLTASERASGRATCRGRAGSPGASTPGWSGSTITARLPPRPRRRGPGSKAPASASFTRSSGCTRWWRSGSCPRIAGCCPSPGGTRTTRPAARVHRAPPDRLRAGPARQGSGRLGAPGQPGGVRPSAAARRALTAGEPVDWDRVQRELYPQAAATVTPPGRSRPDRP